MASGHTTTPSSLGWPPRNAYVLLLHQYGNNTAGLRKSLNTAPMFGDCTPLNGMGDRTTTFTRVQHTMATFTDFRFDKASSSTYDNIKSIEDCHQNIGEMET